MQVYAGPYHRLHPQTFGFILFSCAPTFAWDKVRCCRIHTSCKLADPCILQQQQSVSSILCLYFIEGHQVHHSYPQASLLR